MENLDAGNEIKEPDLDPKAKLKRFCYLGSYMAVFVHHRSYVNASVYFHQILKLCDCLDQETFLQILKDVLSRSTLVRRDEPIFCYAAYLASNVEAKQKTAMRDAIIDLLTTDDDLFLFAKYSSLIQDVQKRKGFSKTTHKAVRAWYKHQTCETLLKMWCRRRGKCGYTHADLIRACYVTEDIIGNSHLSLAFLKKCSKLLHAAEQKTGTKNLLLKNETLEKNAPAATVAVDLKTNETKKTTIDRATEFENNGAIKDPVALTVIAVSQLRNMKDGPEAFKIIKEQKLSYDEVPAYFYRFPSIANLLLPQMPYRQLLKNCRQFFKLRNLQNPKTWGILKNALGNKQKISKSNIHPLEFLISMNRIGIRWKPTVSNVNSHKIHDLRIPFFNTLYRDSFGKNQATGLRLFVTMSLQDSYKQKILTNYYKLKYIEAAVALAFGYFKKEKICDVHVYTEDRVQLQLLPWTKDMSIEKAMSCCENYQNPKTGARLVVPLMSAMKESQIYDLFLVIVPTAGRNNPKQKSDFLCMFLDKYRQSRNPRAKFVIVNLRKFKKSMEYSTTRNENILEICGIDEHTVGIIM